MHKSDGQSNGVLLVRLSPRAPMHPSAVVRIPIHKIMYSHYIIIIGSTVLVSPPLSSLSSSLKSSLSSPLPRMLCSRDNSCYHPHDMPQLSCPESDSSLLVASYMKLYGLDMPSGIMRSSLGSSAVIANSVLTRRRRR